MKELPFDRKSLPGKRLLRTLEFAKEINVEVEELKRKVEHLQNIIKH